MIRSMTAYGRGECRQDDILYIVEIRTVNHRYRDIILRMPKNILILEKDLKSMIASWIRRGRIEVFIEMKHEGGAVPYALELNSALAQSYFDIFSQLARQFGLDQEIMLDSVVKMKDVIIARPPEIDVAATRQGIETALAQALDPLEEMRCREGEAIEADFLHRCDLLEQYLDAVERRAPDLVAEYRSRLKANIDLMLTDVAADEARIAQEVAFFAEKADITEEIVRIRSHLNQFREYLSKNADSIGRKLDFLIQELNREVNTIGSKTSDALAAINVVEMKAELEKLREQVQNVE